MTQDGHSPTGGGYGSTGGGNMTIGDYANGAPNIRLSQIPASFARQLPWMIPLLMLMFAASWWFTKDIKREYTADGRILVQLGSEYVYNPVGAGNNNGGMTITPDQVVLTEIDIIKNAASMENVIRQMAAPVEVGCEKCLSVGGEAFAPKLWDKWVRAQGTPDEKNRWNDIVKNVDKSFVVMPKPKSSIVNLVYKHEDGDVAVKALTAMMLEYQRFRKEIFVFETTEKIGERREATESQLNVIESRIQNILNKNGISDFVAEQGGVQKRAEEQKAALNKLRGQLSAVEAALAATEDQLRNTPPTIDLYVDDRASQRLAQAELEKRQLLAKYLPTSNPVKAKEAEIAQIRAQIGSYGGKATGGRRVGPNTVYQALMTQRNTYQAQADSFREQEVTIVRQLTSADALVKRMRQLGPVYQSLVREKVSLETRLTNLNVREGEALVNKALDEANSENIKFINMPSTPRKGRNMKKIMFALGMIGSGFTVMMLALLRVFLDPRLYGPDPQARIGSPNSRSRRKSDKRRKEDKQDDPSTIPEPVPAYAPAAERVAQTASPGRTTGTAAAVADTPRYDWEPEVYTPQPNDFTGYDQGGNDPTQQLGVPDVQPYKTQIYADGSSHYTQPHVSSAPTAYPNAAIPNSTPAQFAGVNADVPVLGSVGPRPAGT
jgi:uncharacterized protein involved in exopolysaccharide biosynthesis